MEGTGHLWGGENVLELAVVMTAFVRQYTKSHLKIINL